MTPAGGRGVVVAVCRAAGLHEDPGPVGVTAIDKRPVAGRVPVRTLGLRGDVQADRAHHGGADKAVYVLDEAEAQHWAAALGRDVPAGSFGENLRTAGVPVDDCEIGERWAVGPDLVLEVTGPRTPCATFGRWLGEAGWVRRFTERGRPGAYLRVVEPGTVAAGDVVERAHVPGHGVTVASLLGGAEPVDAVTLLAAAADGVVDLAEYVRGPLLAAAGRAAG